MIFLSTSEANAFDMLSVLFIKKNKSSDLKHDKLHDSLYQEIKKQLDSNLFITILASQEYEDLYQINLKIFDSVAKVRKDEVTGSYMERLNQDRFAAKQKLQTAFFNGELSEAKI